MFFNKIINKLLSEDSTSYIFTSEMVSSGVVGGSGYEGGIAPQDNIPYAKGDSRIPKLLFTKGKKKKKKLQIQRRPKISM